MCFSILSERPAIEIAGRLAIARHFMRLRPLLFAIVVWHSAHPALGHHFRYTANLTGAAEAPANGSAGVGHAVITLDVDELIMEVAATFSGLQGTVTAANIHAPTASTAAGTADVATQVPTFANFPVGVSDGDYEHEFDLADAGTYNAAFIAASGGTISDALNALYFALENGKAYFNIHTSEYGDGEIRGFLSRVPGDYNDNGIVDAPDYALWRHTYGKTGEGLPADSNNDNVINDDDYTAWRDNFGNSGLSSGAGAGAMTQANVPEPAAFVLVATAIISYLARRNTAKSGR
jgi:hypothetical protein